VSVDDSNNANYGPNKPLNEDQRILLIPDAQNPKVWLTGSEDSPVLMAFDALHSDGTTHLNLIKYDNFNNMKSNSSSEHVVLAKSNSSASESKPSFQGVKWHGSIANSEITLLYEFKTSGGAVKLGKGKHDKDGSWTAIETNQDTVYKADGLTEKFSPFHKFTYQDETFYLTGTERM